MTTDRTHTRQLGQAQVSVITDGAVTFGVELFPGTSGETIAAHLQQAGQDAIHTNFNATLIRTGGRVVLADGGPRELFGPTCGNLGAGLAELGVSADMVDTLLATHLHPDHVAGFITPEGAAVFPKARLVVTQAEYDFWGNPDNFTGALAGAAGYSQLARAIFAAYGDRLDLVGPDASIAPGLSIFDLPGHTPGHCGWRLESDGAHLVHVGDIIHAPDLQIADPEIAIVYDMDTDTARATRKRLLDELATDGALFTGGHLLAPKFLRVERSGAGYRVVA
jgi:glyoxylase-like metal-dependent hydrolase (beta-lactamase superfamily II)